MKREIKFRGKSIRAGKWVYGYYCKGLEDDQIISDSCIILCDPATIGQYTGLKDNDGKEIYEGDIVVVQPEGYFDPVKAVVRWGGTSYPAFDLYVKSKRRKSGWETLSDEYNSLSADLSMKIIGNIHQEKTLSK